MDFDKIIERLGNVKLRGGIFGKMTWAVIVICICITALAFKADNIYLIGATIFGMMIFAFYSFNGLLGFADKHPQFAILDGSEFLMHEQILHASKGQGTIPPQANVIDHAQPEIDRALIEADDAAMIIEG